VTASRDLAVAEIKIAHSGQRSHLIGVISQPQQQTGFGICRYHPEKVLLPCRIHTPGIDPPGLRPCQGSSIIVIAPVLVVVSLAEELTEFGRVQNVFDRLARTS
jgi:hypothetical protein